MGVSLKVDTLSSLIVGSLRRPRPALTAGGSGDRPCASVTCTSHDSNTTCLVLFNTPELTDFMTISLRLLIVIFIPCALFVDLKILEASTTYLLFRR
ncbi:hypothetical protein BDV41DRAFT_395088 [Aspergillus transmontanensis]|uniref:Uncharacterized protein n=1 Tax=Aspergillus transmontanensis TaxID=1034304 RepID=A0A5N6VPH9_9EURO|nr:hypothetical protein BDV41DRAFT_395088 [Aspergillus transmontanensis]